MTELKLTSFHYKSRFRVNQQRTTRRLLICIDIYPCVTAYVTRMYQPGLCGMVSRKMNSLEFSHRHHFRIRPTFRILNSLEFSIVSKHEAGRIWLRNTSPHEYNLLFVIKCRGESNVCGQHLQQKSF